MAIEIQGDLSSSSIVKTPDVTTANVQQGLSAPLIEAQKIQPTIFASLEDLHAAFDELCGELNDSAITASQIAALNSLGSSSVYPTLETSYASTVDDDITMYSARTLDKTTGEIVTNTYSAYNYPPFNWGAITQTEADRQKYSAAYGTLINQEGVYMVLRDPSTNIFWVTLDNGEVQYYDLDANNNPIQVMYNQR